MAKISKTDKYAMDINEFIDKLEKINKLEVPKNYIEVKTIHGELESKLRRSKKAE